jgi:hypothetical protein
MRLASVYGAEAKFAKRGKRKRSVVLLQGVTTERERAVWVGFTISERREGV